MYIIRLRYSLSYSQQRRNISFFLSHTCIHVYIVIRIIICNSTRNLFNKLQQIDLKYRWLEVERKLKKKNPFFPLFFSFFV